MVFYLCFLDLFKRIGYIFHIDLVLHGADKKYPFLYWNLQISRAFLSPKPICLCLANISKNIYYLLFLLSNYLFLFASPYRYLLYIDQKIYHTCNLFSYVEDLELCQDHCRNELKIVLYNQHQNRVCCWIRKCFKVKIYRDKFESYIELYIVFKAIIYALWI